MGCTNELFEIDWYCVLGVSSNRLYLWILSTDSFQFYCDVGMFTLYNNCIMIKKILIAALVVALLLTALYFGVIYGLISVVLFISDVIMEISSLIW